MRSRSITISIICITMFIFIGLLVCDIISIKDRVIKCNQGEANVLKFDESDPFIIAGEWEVYKDKLIISENLDVSTIEKEYTSSLYKSIKDGKEMKYYSYRVVLHSIPKHYVLSNSSNTFKSGYAVYINRQLVRTDNNFVDKDGNKLVVDDKATPYYVADDEDIEIIVELSNKTSSYYAFINNFYLDGNTGHFSLISFQAVYLIIIIGCSLLGLYFTLLCISRKNFLRNILIVAINICAIGSVLFNGETTFFKLPMVPALLENSIKILFYYLATTSFAILATTDFGTKKMGKFQYLLLGSTALVVVLELVLPINFSVHTLGVICVFAIGVLIYSTIRYLKTSKKDPMIQVTITFYLIETIGCYIYEIMTLTPILPYNKSSLSILLFLSCVLLTALNGYLRESEASKSSLTTELNNKIRDTEFVFLNSQIQSHFIYNTLNSIQALCNTNPEKAGELVEEFSFYLRNRLEFNKIPNLIDLKDEIDHIKTYINIEQTRFGDSVKCVYDLKVTDIKIPPLSIQPLVENAVKHGVSKQVGGGTITLSTYEDKKNVYIRVQDNGLGFDTSSLKDSKRVGFNNIKDRLELYLGGKIELVSKIGVGTTVTITIPKKNLTTE